MLQRGRSWFLLDKPPIESRLLFRREGKIKINVDITFELEDRGADYGYTSYPN
jgi:hypothetical protein